MTFFDERAARAKATIDSLAKALRDRLGEDAERILRSDTCVYVVGSGGRGEMSAHSDVDLFVARVNRPPTEFDAFRIREAIAQASFELKLPDPSQGGEFLKMHTAESLCERMGTPADDAANTLTARMLLLLESQVLLGPEAYDALLTKVVNAYWKDDVGHDHDYQPFVLVNDIVRYWRILLLNYVAKNAEKERELSPPDLEAERRLRSYKLRFSRCMTCFSVLAELLAASNQGPVTRGVMLTIVKLRPIMRLAAIREQAPVAAGHVARLLELYETFLKNTDSPKRDLVKSFMDEPFSKCRAQEGRDFGEAMFSLLQDLGRDGRGKELFRHLVV